MAVNTASRLAIITILALIIAYEFRPTGLGVLFGLALFQVVLVASTALPVWKKLRTGATDHGLDGGDSQGDAQGLPNGVEGNGNSDE
jgi:hypothetical protein